MTEMTNSIIHIHKVLRSRDTTDKNIQQTLICALGHHDLALTLCIKMHQTWRTSYSKPMFEAYSKENSESLNCQIRKGFVPT